jgi:glutaconate CoA-transferase subunit A
MESKLTSLSEAVRLIKDGSSVALGGATLYRRPMAAAREIIRQGINGLTVISAYGGPETDMLIGAGAVSTVRCGYLGLEIFGLAPNFRRAASDGRLKIIEEGEFTLLLGLRAALLNTTFIPARTLFWGSDLLKFRPDIKEFSCPVTGERLLAVPALRPDIAIIHVQKADRFGNAEIGGQLSLDVELAYAAKMTVLTAEKIVDQGERIRSGKPDIIQHVVDAVVKVPFGAHPSSCYPYYSLDVPHMLAYVESAKDSESFQRYVREYVLDVKTHEDYLRKAVSSLSQLVA